MLPQFCHDMPSSFAGQCTTLCRRCLRRAFAALWLVFGGGLSPSLTHEEGPLVIGRRESDTDRVVTYTIIRKMRYGHCNKGISKLSIFAVFVTKGLILFENPIKNKLFYKQTPYLSFAIEIVWFPIPMCRVHWKKSPNTVQVESVLTSHFFQILLCLNGPPDVTNYLSYAYAISHYD